jgi:hypothetical protein
LEKGGELQKQGLSVNRLSQKLPRTRPISLEALRSPGRAGSCDDDRSSCAEAGIATKLATYIEPMYVGHLRVKDNDIGLSDADPLESLLSGIGSNH